MEPATEKKNSEFWDEVYEYISNHYDLDKVKKIYLSSDGETWIKSGFISTSWGLYTIISEGKFTQSSFSGVYGNRMSLML